jgi:L-fuculose-phosphate aldolase
MINGFGSMEVPCVAYYPFGSEQLGESGGKALADRTACLLANHGMLARGTTLLAAFERALKLETRRNSSWRCRRSAEVRLPRRA